MKAPLATSAHAAARRDAATAFESAEATAAAVRWSTANLNRMGTARPVDFWIIMKKTATKRRIAVPGCATEMRYR